MRPSFNTAGPCIPGEHYMLPPERRLGGVMRLIDEQKFFTLTAGRQTGKTTSARWIVRHLNATEGWRALWVDIQEAREEPDPTKAFRTVLNCFAEACEFTLPNLAVPTAAEREVWLLDPATCIEKALSWLVKQDSRRWVVLFDEADGLVGAAMVSFLTQLRKIYIQRDTRTCPSSVILVGQRQVRDYALREEDRRVLSWLGTTSPFNVTAEAMTIGTFSESEVAELLAQHTKKTGQQFLPDAAHEIYRLGQGHPWLTNAMADQIVNRDVEDRSIAITVEHVEASKETIILERRTHIDSLIARLREERIRKILDPMLAGGQTVDDVLDDDFAYVKGLGLIRFRAGHYEIANPIYREVIPRALTFVRQTQIMNEPEWYVRPDGSLDMPKLFKDWQKFWREDGHLAAEGFAYRESGPHLMLMAFLQRVVNGGGKIEREYGLGRKALDLLVVWKSERHAIELKIRRNNETEQRGIEQLAGYLDKLGLTEGWLVLFDLRKELSWKEKLFIREISHEGKLIRLVGC
jgi:hypothetical protein